MSTIRNATKPVTADAKADPKADAGKPREVNSKDDTRSMLNEAMNTKQPVAATTGTSLNSNPDANVRRRGEAGPSSDNNKKPGSEVSPIPVRNKQESPRAVEPTTVSQPPSLKSMESTETLVERGENKPVNKLKNMMAQKASQARPDANANTTTSTSANAKQAVSSSSSAVPKQPRAAGGISVGGTNIGSRHREPEWTKEQLEEIERARTTRLGNVTMNETRRNIQDPDEYYLTIAGDGTTTTFPPAFLGNITTDKYMLGIGKPKSDEKTGKSKSYCDVVMKGTDMPFVISQWTAKNVIMEGVPDYILNKAPRFVNGRMERRIGHEFARIGLGKREFGPIFETLAQTMPSLLEGVSKTAGYYWLNASWGVTGSPARFIYTYKGQKQETTRLHDAMRIISGHSSMGIAAIAISISNECEKKGGKVVSSSSKFELSIKIHNMFHAKKVSYHSPPQAASTGFEISQDMLNEVEDLNPGSSLSEMISSTDNVFSNPISSGGMNPFSLSETKDNKETFLI